jgi:hypothetical protein
MRPRKKDPSFLYMGSVAAIGGLMAIGFSIGLPLWNSRHGHGYNPAFTLFAAWGVAALCGAYACVKTYFLTDGVPPKPPGGGVRLEFKRNAEPAAAPAKSAAQNPSQRRAA